MDPSKVDVIMKWLKPTNVIEVRSFLGAIKCWRRFIVNFFVIIAPLHALKSVKQDF